MTNKKQHIRLEDIPKRNIYEVPEGYFDSLPMRVMDRVAAPESAAAAWYTSFWRPLRLAMAPLALLLAFAVVYVLNMQSDSEKHIANLAAVGDKEIVDYLSTYAVLESSDLAEVHSISGQVLPADFLNVSASSAEEELEYARLDTTGL
ncbi:hypothetical protein [Pontibacter ruber]|uniref:Uncharacterized protein n=1 Tax=Pontibacter ruber TaxID=1343895 RepID=A0ABW5CXQ9_9BACT|nr:hypothetical protein [Pontibacter ruber]